jgi:hypothetical protein
MAQAGKPDGGSPRDENTRPTAYVLHHGDGVRNDFHFTGPFDSVMRASLWADTCLPDKWWFVLDLANDPATETPMIMAPDGQRVAVNRPPYVYALCWSDAEFHLVGPFPSIKALNRYSKDASECDHRGPDDGAFGPHGDDLRWYPVELMAPAGPPRVDPPPPVWEIPTKPTREGGTKRMKMCRRAAFVHEVIERVAAVAASQMRLN